MFKLWPKHAIVLASLAAISAVAAFNIANTSTPKIPLSVSASPGAVDCFGAICAESVPAFLDFDATVTYLESVRLMQNNLNSVPQKLDLSYNCHAVLHAIGTAAYKGSAHTAASLSDLVDIDDARCLSAYLHGLLEQWGRTTPLDSVTSHVQVLCAKHYTTTLASNACSHGLGHALYSSAKGDLLAALSGCEQLLSSSMPWCASGVFMSIVSNGDLDVTTSPPVTAANAHSFCSRVPDIHQSACWFKYSYIALSFDIGPSYVIQTCKTLLAEFRSACFKGVGEVYFTAGAHNMFTALAFCAPLTKDASACRLGVSFASANIWFGEGRSPQNFVGICSIVPGIEMDACHLAAEEGAKRALPRMALIP